MDGAGDAPRVVTLTGAALLAALDDLAALRIAVFREWPYLYAGGGDEASWAYERDYLTAYARSDRSVIVGAYAPDGQLVGAATAAPLAEHAAEFAEAFRARGLDPGALYYFGESVLLPEWRGRGIGHEFFDQREAAGRAHGFAMACFCAVVRPEEHVLKPAGYRPLDPFWRRRGYAPMDGLIASFPWADRGEGGLEADHPMQFWMAPLQAL